MQLKNKARLLVIGVIFAVLIVSTMASPAAAVTNIQAAASKQIEQKIYANFYSSYPTATGRQINTVKELRDFADNIYYVVEFEPTGYAIYDKEYEVVMETSDEAKSPYNGTDPFGHGTHVAGIIGAQANNGGFAGVAWDVRFVSLRVFDANGNGNNYSTNLENAIIYADANDIPIINHSGGGYTSYPAVERAIRNYSGLFVAAAGNDSNNNDSSTKFYPASYDFPNIISVGATDKQDRQSGFRWQWVFGWRPYESSNYGATSVDIFAPGGGDVTINSEMVYSTLPGNNYGYMSGTSMAAPHVAGVAALILSKYPDIVPIDLKYIIVSSADRLQNLDNLCTSGSRLNAYKALTAAKNFVYPPNSPIKQGKAYSIKNVGTGKVFDVDGWSTANGTDVEQYDFNAGSNQRFIAVYNLGDNTFSFKPIHAKGKFVENVNGNLKIYDNHGNANIGQSFQIIKRSNGYSIHNQGKAMAVTNNNSASRITPENFNVNDPKHIWTFEESWQTSVWTNSATNEEGTITSSTPSYPQPIWSPFDGIIGSPHCTVPSTSGWLQLKLNYNIKIYRIDFYQMESGNGIGTKNAYFTGTNGITLGSHFVGSTTKGGKTIISVNNVITNVVQLNVTSVYTNYWGSNQIIIFGVRV